MNDLEEKYKFFDLKKAVIFVLITALSYSLMALLVKLLRHKTNLNTIVFFRYGVSVMYVLIVMVIRKIYSKSISLKTKHFFCM